MRLKLIVLALLSCLCLFGCNQSKVEQRINEGLNAISEMSEENFYNAGYDAGSKFLDGVNKGIENLPTDWAGKLGDCIYEITQWMTDLWEKVKTLFMM